MSAQTFKVIAKLVSTTSKEDLVQYVTGVNTEASFIHTAPGQVMFFSKADNRWYSVGTLLLFLSFDFSLKEIVSVLCLPVRRVAPSRGQKCY